MKIIIIFKSIWKAIKGLIQFEKMARKFNRVFRLKNGVKIIVKIGKWKYDIWMSTDESNKIKTQKEAQEWVMKNVYEKLLDKEKSK